MTEELLLECKKYIESGGIPFGSSFEKVSVR